MSSNWSALRLVVEGLRPGAGGFDGKIARRRERDWRAPFRLANSHFVAPSLYVNLRNADGLGDLPRDAVNYLALLRRNNEVRNTALRRQALELLGALQAAGISPLLLKGALALFLEHYSDPGERMIRDLDVQVPKALAKPALAVLHDLGYRIQNLYPPGHHAYGEFARPNDPAAIDLHFEIVDAAALLPAAEMRRRADAVKFDGVDFLVPSVTDRLLHNLLHAQIHYLGNYYRGVLELRELHEFATLSRRFGADIDWDLIASRMRQHRLDVPLHSYAFAAKRLLALRWPLGDPPRPAAVLHYTRCVAQLHLRPLALLGVPWGNLRSSFAWHRLRALYREPAALPILAVRHTMQYLRKKPVRAAVGRLFRVR